MYSEIELESFRAQRETRLRDKNGWLSVLGLYWLQEGNNVCGNADDCDILINIHNSQKFNIQVNGDEVIFDVAETINASVKGELFTRRRVKDDLSKAPDTVQIGSISIELLRRNGAFGIRVRDSKSLRPKQFPALEWFPSNKYLCVPAIYEQHEAGRTMPIELALGGEYDFANPGVVKFELNGQQYSLEALRQGKAEQLFLIFKDATNGMQSYGAGRFLFIPFSFPEESQTSILLDFNKAISPPCAFTDAATCPLPPATNYLPVAINAGECDPQKLITLPVAEEA